MVFDPRFQVETNVTTTYAAGYAGKINCDATGGAFTVTLPDATLDQGARYTIKKTDASANAITIATTSSQTIDGSSTKSLANRYEVYTVYSNGTNWSVEDAPSVTSVSNADGTLTISPITGAVVASIASSAALPGAPTTTTAPSSDNSSKVATTAFVTTAVANAIAGVNPAMAVQAATTGVLPNSPTYSNGVSGIGATLTAGSNSTLTVDGYTFAINERCLVKNQASALQNGVYFISQVGSGILPWILTRALDYDMPSDMNYTGAIPVLAGTVNLDTSWVLTSIITTVGTDAVTFTQFTVNPLKIYQTVQNQGTAVTQRTILDFAGAGLIAQDDSSNTRTIVYSVNPAELSLLGGL